MPISKEQLKINLEIILDKIAEALITNISKYTHSGTTPAAELLANNQKTIKNGIVQTITGGLGSDDILVLYQKELKANPEDASLSPMSGLANIVDSWGDVDVNSVLVWIDGVGAPASIAIWLANTPSGAEYIDITDYVVGNWADGNYTNPVNLSQFINLYRPSNT